jgi:hypothetical protein
MTEQERFQRFVDLQELVLTKGYKCLIKMLDEQIKEEQETFLRVDSDNLRLEKQIRLKLLHEFKGWADEEIFRCKNLGRAQPSGRQQPRGE